MVKVVKSTSSDFYNIVSQGSPPVALPIVQKDLYYYRGAAGDSLAGTCNVSVSITGSSYPGRHLLQASPVC